MAIEEETKHRLTAILGGNVLFDEPMAAHTYFKVGGPADVLALPENRDDLAALLGFCAEARMRYRIVGGGTNLLVSDAGIRGIVIRLGKGFKSIRQSGSVAGRTLVTATAGTSLQALCRYANNHGLAGMNAAVGIPGSVGGALMMNAGTSAGCVADVVEAIGVMTAGGQVHTIERHRLSAGYRQMTWAERSDSHPDRPPILVDGCFGLRPADAAVLKAEARSLREKRQRTQPVDQPSAGCFFKNPGCGKSAGELIERAGMKGKTMGGAQISEQHANYIVNRGGATAAQILALSDAVRQVVARKFNIELETEVKIVGP